MSIQHLKRFGTAYFDPNDIIGLRFKNKTEKDNEYMIVHLAKNGASFWMGLEKNDGLEEFLKWLEEAK